MNFIRQIFLALNYMHKRNIVHRDIKPENILMSNVEKGKIEIKITDFGFATCYKQHEQTLNQVLGTRAYMAPEIIKNLEYGPKVDIWSAGVLVYLMIKGELPFNGTKDTIY